MPRALRVVSDESAGLDAVAQNGVGVAAGRSFVPGAAVIGGFVYGAAFIGQGLGAEQMYELRAVVDRVAEQGTRASDR